MEEPLIELRDIYKVYQMGDEEVRASDGVSLTIRRGEFVAVVGKSGSGKSTLMNIIGALDVPTEGEYLRSLVLQGLYAPIQGNTRDRKREWVG